MGVLNICDVCPGDILDEFPVDILMGVLAVFERCPRDIWTVSRRYMMGFLEIF